MPHLGVQWLSDRVLDLRPNCRHCIVSVSKTHESLLSTGLTQEDPSGHNWKILDWPVKNQIKQNAAFHQSLHCNGKKDLQTKEYIFLKLYPTSLDQGSKIVHVHSYLRVEVR